MDVASTLVGIDSFQVGSVPNHVVLVYDTVAAMHVSCISCNLKRFGTIVSFNNTDHLWS